MSLRARLIVAMAVVGVVLVLAAIAITTTTESHLLGQLDDRLQEVVARQGFGQPSPHPGGDDFREDGPVSSFYVSYLSPTGVIDVHDKPVSKDGYQPDPNLPVDDIANLAPGEHAYYSVGSDGGPRYRVLATRPANGQAAIVVGTARTTWTTPSGGS